MGNYFSNHTQNAQLRAKGFFFFKKNYSMSMVFTLLCVTSQTKALTLDCDDCREKIVSIGLDNAEKKDFTENKP